MKIHIHINTFEREEQLKELIQSIYNAKPDNCSIDISVYNDGSKDKEGNKNHYTYEGKFFDKLHITYTYLEHNGKAGYWKTVNKGFNDLYGLDYDYYYKLDDDDTVKLDFFTKSIDMWNAIDDSQKICLTIDRPSWTKGKPNFTNINPIIKRFGARDVILSQWVDGTFMCEKRFFETLDFQILPIEKDFENSPDSGVGLQLSERLLGRGWNMYMVTSSLVFTKDSMSSKMHPIERLRNPKIQVY